MSINMENDHNTPTDTVAYFEYYEELAGQEELYLEETEEQVRAILVAYVSRNDRSTMTGNCGLREPDRELRESLTDRKNNPRTAESFVAQLIDASEELITGDSDDPPLSDETVKEMLRIA